MEIFTKIFFILVLLKCYMHNVESAKILAIFQVPSKSHHILGSALLKELAKRGHDVTMISPFPFKKPVKNYRDINLEEMHKFKEDHMMPLMSPNISTLQMFRKISTIGQLLNDVVWSNKGVQDLLKSGEQFDAIILVPMFYESFIGMAHHFNTSAVILFSPVGRFPNVNKATGNPSGVSYLPNLFLQLGNGDVTHVPFFVRVANVLMSCITYVFHEIIDNRMDEVLQKHLPNSPSISELQKNVSLVLMNGHFSIDPPKAQVPNMISIGGFHVGELKPLPTDIKQYLDNAKEGAVLFCFGTNIEIGSIKEKWNAIMKGLGNISPIKVIFKSEVDIPDAPDNILFKKWLPQTDILGHPNLKAFITHGGFGGTTETIYHGVPILGIPFYGDQRTNVAENVNKGFGVQLNYDDLTEESFTKALKEILNNPKYSEKIKKTSILMKDQPIKPMDHAIYWVEYVIRHKGARHLRAGSSYQTWYQYYLVDVLLFILLVTATLLYISCKLFKLTFRVLKRMIFSKKLKTN